MKCELDPKYHNCEYLNRDTLECHNQTKCSFQKNEIESIKTKEPKWFEKYYK